MAIVSNFKGLSAERQREVRKIYRERRKEHRKLLFEDLVKKIKERKKKYGGLTEGLNVFYSGSYELSVSLINNKVTDINLDQINIERNKKVSLLKREKKEIEKIVDEKNN